MDSRHDPITAFGCGELPEESGLVVWDGFDQLDKEDAVRFFAGKTWRDVLLHLRHLKDEPVFRGAYFLEEWAVLSPSPLAYYARAYLEYLRETLASSRRDEEFVFYFLGRLNDLAQAGWPFDQTQTAFLRRAVQKTIRVAARSGSFEYFANDIKQQAEEFLAKTATHDN